MGFKFFRQLESNDCGTTCVKMVAKYYGKDVSMKYLKDFCEYTKTGISIKDVIRCFNHVGMEAIAIKASLQQLSTVPLPAILFWDNNHFVVLYKIKNIKDNICFYLADPAYGKIKLYKSTFVSHWIKDNKGILILSEPRDDQSKYGVSPDLMSMISTFARKYIYFKRKISFSVLLIFAATITNWFIPQLFQEIIDKGVQTENINIVYKLSLVQGVLLLSYLLCSNISSILLMKVNLSVGTGYLSDLLKKYMRLPLSFFDSKIRTDLIQRMSDQNRLQNFLTYRVIDFIFYLLNVAVFATLLFKYDPFIFIIFFSLSLIAFIWSLTFLKRRRILDYHRFAEQNVNSNVVYEIINGMHDIKINNDEQYRLKRWEKSQLKLNNYSLRGLLLNYYQLWGASLIDKIRDVIIIIIASIMVINKQSSLGILMTISYIIGQISGSLDKIHSFIRDLQDANISLKRINEVYTKKEERYCGMHIEDKNIYTKGININVDNVFFHYPGLDNPYILKNITFEIPSHKIVALVGNSGCGKTTLAKLLLGFYEPQKGCITNDNYKLSDIPITEWREKCGCVLQDGYIFSDTIAHNIAMGIEKIDYMKLKNVCKMSCIDNYINTLPLKYETVIGNEGLEVSGGQKQRILIARALYKDPDFLVFDEATSHLDAENEAAIMSNLYNYFHDRTILIIAHRLSTVVNADKILFMENGHIIEQGTHDELCDFKGKYYKLVKNQIQLI